MCLRDKQHMRLDTESSTHSGMKDQSKYLLLQVWCGLLTVSMVVMAAFLASIKPKSAQDEVSALKPDNVSLTAFVASLKSTGTSPSYIQLIKNTKDPLWKESPGCNSSYLVLLNNSIYCKKDSLYFFYAQVTFRNTPQSKSVVLKRNAGVGKSVRILAEGKFPNTTEGSVWVAKIVSFKEGDSYSLDILGDVLNDVTVWGAFQLH